MIDLSFKSYAIANTRITSRQFGVPLGSWEADKGSFDAAPLSPE